MKKLISMTLVLMTAAVLTAGSSSIFADDSAASSTTNSSASTKDFDQHKAKILQRISDRLAKIQEIQSCVQAANDSKALHACKPHKHHGDKKHND